LPRCFWRFDRSRKFFRQLISPNCARVGTDHLYWKSGRVGLSKNLDFESRVGSGLVGDLVGRWVGIFKDIFSRKKSFKCILSLVKMIFRKKALRSLALIQISNVFGYNMAFFHCKNRKIFLTFIKCVGKTDQKIRPPTDHRPDLSSEPKSGRVGDVTDPTDTDRSVHLVGSGADPRT